MFLIGIYDSLFPLVKWETRNLSRFQPSAHCSHSVDAWGPSVPVPFLCDAEWNFGGTYLLWYSSFLKTRVNFIEAHLVWLI